MARDKRFTTLNSQCLSFEADTQAQSRHRPSSMSLFWVICCRLPSREDENTANIKMYKRNKNPLKLLLFDHSVVAAIEGLQMHHKSAGCSFWFSFILFILHKIMVLPDGTFFYFCLTVGLTSVLLDIQGRALWARCSSEVVLCIVIKDNDTHLSFRSYWYLLLKLLM